jgi:hypothetical protein
VDAIVKIPPPELLDPATDQNPFLAFLRLAFLYVLDEQTPEVKDHLSDDVLPAIAALLHECSTAMAQLAAFGIEPADEVNDIAVEHWFPALAWLDWLRESHADAVGRVVRALGSWQQCHRLDDIWVADAAVRTTVAWTVFPSARERREWFVFKPAFRGAGMEAEVVVRVTVPMYYEPTVARRADVRRAIRAKVEELAWATAEPYVAEYLDLVDERAKGAGLVRPSRPREVHQQLRRLVRHQVIGLSFSDLAREESLAEPEESGRKTIRDSVASAATLIGLTRRDPDRGGRPKQGKHSEPGS